MGWRSRLLIALAVFSLLGQGERCLVDPRFASPSATLRTYWQALCDGDAETAWDCLTELRSDAPYPGMLWFLPPTAEMRLEQFRPLPVTAGRLMVTYEVIYRPLGERQEQSFVTGSELVRQRGEWRIARPLGEAAMPEWRPMHGPVDI